MHLRLYSVVWFDFVHLYEARNSRFPTASAVIEIHLHFDSSRVSVVRLVHCF